MEYRFQCKHYLLYMHKFHFPLSFLWWVYLLLTNVYVALRTPLLMHYANIPLLMASLLICFAATQMWHLYPVCPCIQINEGDITVDKLSGELLDLVEAKQYPPSVDCLVCYSSPTNTWRGVESTLLRVNLTGTDKGNMCFTCKVKQQAGMLVVNDAYTSTVCPCT